MEKSIDSPYLLLCRVLKRYREELSISLEKIAHRAELDRTYESQIERDIAIPRLLWLCNIATALEVDPLTLPKRCKSCWYGGRFWKVGILSTLL